MSNARISYAKHVMKISSEKMRISYAYTQTTHMTSVIKYEKRQQEKERNKINRTEIRSDRCSCVCVCVACVASIKVRARTYERVEYHTPLIKICING